MKWEDRRLQDYYDDLRRNDPGWQEMVREDQAKRDGAPHLCVCCHRNPVDVYHGADTCQECLANL